jgi:nucleoside-triphosphatase THEP1
MEYKKQLSERWIKAAILGTIWASSEIVLGSFLHNLKIPFSGNILTAIGLVILISASYRWDEKGLFWRAGVICALLKTMSPSAVIFGPMVAIIAEAFLLEFSVRIFGKTIFGFIIGSALAMSWVLFQRILNYIIFYGYNIVELYASLMKYAQKQLYWNFNAVWGPVFILLAINAVFGCFAAIIGIRAGRRLGRGTQTPLKMSNHQTVAPDVSKPKNREFKYSIAWLVADVLFLAGSIFLVNYLHFAVWCIVVVNIAAIWAIRYKRAFRQLVRPKFWIFFFLITMLTAFVFTRISSTENGLYEGLLTGVEMNLRAIVLIMGFSVLGTELYNPKIRNYLMKSNFKQLPLALELSLESLPLMIANIPDFKSIVKNPISVIDRIILQAEQHLAEINTIKNLVPEIYILTGAIGQGKTCRIQQIIEKLKSENKSVGGIFSPKIMEKGQVVGYDVVNILNNERTPFLRNTGNPNQERIGNYYILPEGLLQGKEAIKKSGENKNHITIIDEIGRLELENGGWADEFQKLLSFPGNTFLIVVRNELVEKAIEKWKLKPHKIFTISEIDYSEL